MKTPQSRSFTYRTRDFLFSIRPLSIHFRQGSDKARFLYLEKGIQVLGKVQELVPPNTQQYTFKVQKTMNFRALQEQNLQYIWSLYNYEWGDREVQSYEESVSFGIGAIYRAYLEQFWKLEEDLHRIYKEKGFKTPIQQIWKDLKNDLKNRETSLQSSFPKNKATLAFLLTIQNPYDFMLEKWQQARLKSQLDFIRKKSNSSQKQHAQDKDIVRTQITQDKQSQKEIFNDPAYPITTNEEYYRKQRFQELRESQIKIFDPEGINVTEQSAQRFSNLKRMELDYYTKKQTSMLSDILEESYEGSSNINQSKSNQAQKLKSMDQIQEEQEPLFSPMIKTQTFQSTHGDLNELKRTATLKQKSSQEREAGSFSQTVDRRPVSKSCSVGPSYNLNKDKKPSGKGKSDQRFPQGNQQGQLMVEEEFLADSSEAKINTTTNLVKVFLFVAAMLLLITVVFDNQKSQSQFGPRPTQLDKSLTKRKKPHKRK